MDARSSNNFRYLNREGRWLDFDWHGLELGAGGALRLLASPRLDAAPERALDELPPVTAPAGLACDARGRVFQTIPERNELWMSSDCSGRRIPLECITEREGIGPLSAPRGLCVLERSRRLLVADAQQRRILFLDLNDFRLREVWGGQYASLDSACAFDEPCAIAADADENVYVLDHGRQRVLRFSRRGEHDAEFAQRTAASGLVARPSAIAVAPCPGGPLVFIADRHTQLIRVFDRCGDPVRDSKGLAVAISHTDGRMGDVFALAADAHTLFVGDNLGRRLLSFRIRPTYPFAGDAVGFSGPSAALARDREGGLYVHAGDAEPPLRLEAAGAHVSAGVFWSVTPIGAGGPAVTWNTLRARLTEAAGAHIQLFYALGDKPCVPHVDCESGQPFSDPAWIPLPVDVSQAYLSKQKARYAFLGARLTGDRLASVALAQLRVDFDERGYEDYLPALYREPASDNAFLHRYLALFQSVFDEIEAEIRTLPKYFDPAAAPAAALPWLASWLATPIDEEEPEPRMRQAIASAFERQQTRGTAEGLRRALLEEAGVHATISEPIMTAEPFWMPSASCAAGATPQGPALGFCTHLPSAEPGAAVLGTTATLDRSYLITDDQFGEPLFEGAAHQFVVEVFQGDVQSAARLARVRSIIEREKPAHTLYRLEILETGLRVSQQARVGVDTLLGGSRAPSPLGSDAEEHGLRLGGDPAPRVGLSRLGEDIRL